MDSYLLITGASSGVGKVLAENLSSEYNVILSGRNRSALEETAALCKNKTLIWEQDLSRVEELEANLKAFIREQQIQVHKLVHCAGDMKMLPCKLISYEAFLKTFSVNVFSAALIIKTLTSRRINQKALDSAVLISSNISNRGAKTFSVYGSSKAAVDGLVRNLAMELAPHTRINSILPGGMKTKMTEEIFNDENVQSRFRERYPLGIGTPQDLVGMVQLLLSERASWITGQQFVIDGGRTIDVTE